jgi:hypothetical protein
MPELSAERGLVRAFYPEHVSCLATADPTRDPEWGLVCNGCGVILGFPGEPDRQAPEVGGAGVPSEPVTPPARSLGRGSEPGVSTDPEPPEEPLVEPEPTGDLVGFADGGSDADEDDDPPWDEPERRLIAHEPVINDMPPAEQAPPPNPHGSVDKSAVIPQDPIMAALDVIDPTRPYTPAEVESQLVDLEARLERGQHFQRVWEERAYRTKLAFTMAYEADLVRIYEETKAPQDIRQAQARTENKTLYEDMTLAEMMVRAVRESMHNLRSQLSGFQSIARSVGASMTGRGYQT